MDYKEKLEEAKRLYETANVDQRYVLESLFPELKESGDEKVKKAIFGMLYDSDDELWSSYDVSKSDVLAWLEKQGEQKPTDVRTTGYWHVEDVEQKPWSEEDDMVLNSILDSIQREGVLEKKRKTDWLKSLKGRYTWKPSDEQMKCLDNVKGSDDHNGYVLNTLYNDLKKLKG